MPSSFADDSEKLSDEESKRYVRPMNELWAMWGPRVKMRIYPFTYAVYEDVERVMTTLTSYDKDKWAAAWSSIAKPYEEKAAQAEKAGDAQNAEENYLRAYQYYRLARYPTINSDGKKQAYRKSQEMLFKASQFFDFPLERVEIPLPEKRGKATRLSLICDYPKRAVLLFPCL
jgi:hypothetical protein